MQIIQRYLKLVLVSYTLVVVLRFLETILIAHNYGWQPHLLCHETAGILVDMLIVNSLFLILFPLYFLLYRMNVRLADYGFLVVLFMAAILHMGIIKYFIYQLIPLDIFVYQYSLSEVLFTIRSSDTEYFSLIIAMALLLSAGLILYKLLGRAILQRRLVRIFAVFVMVSLPVVVFEHSALLSLNKFSSNKSYYFVHRSLSWWRDRKNDNDLFLRVFNDYQQIFRGKKYIRRDYPLLHRFENKDVLGTYFRKVDIPPNIVILIVEGLNDDFVHPFRGTDLMPFLSDLKDKSLYWDHFFTTGERSFSAIPSILGGLPYGEKGFTLLDNLPYHFSLVNVLRMNDYFTSFFYGQGSWFHRKDRYFNYQNTDLIVDNKKFSEKYTRIIVGKDNFFWGYNDKDLFSQSFEVLDTLPDPLQKRLDIYFTGTSHSPYQITNPLYYDQLFDKNLALVKNPEDVRFLISNKKYVQSILFVDDALKYFFETYQKRPEYGNTIFIITGDHPMSEIPAGNALKKYRVPLILYSPLLTGHKVFHGVSDYSDVYETLLSYLSSNYDVQVPPVSTSLGTVLDTATLPQNNKSIAFMNDNREVIDFYDNGYFLSGTGLFKISEDLDMTSISDKKKATKMAYKLAVFNEVSKSVSVNRKIIPEDLFFQYLHYKTYYSKTDKQLISFDTEFHDIITHVPVSNRPFYFDLSMQCTKKADTTVTIVFQLFNLKDSVVYWRNFGLPENGIVQEHFTIGCVGVKDSILYFSSYFWNTKRKKIEYAGLESFVYGK
ncbi:MAG: sulfatase-like hydrolase/transferase [Bacteroidetes bacterium]|nr:sulfatase-like hydrolase/transferase [Bacteroidota bacterium]